MEKVFIGFGSNQGDPPRNCLLGVESLRRHPMVRIRRVSSLYRTKPVGFAEQKWFINGVLECGTELTPDGLLDVVLGIEADFGRIREVRWGPRTLDMDILAFGERLISLERLIVPHPRLHERLFVLAPLVEIAPDWVHPVLKMTVSELLDDVDRQKDGQKVQLLE